VGVVSAAGKAEMMRSVPLWVFLITAAQASSSRYTGQLTQLASYTTSNTYGIATASASASMRVWTTAAGAERTTTNVQLTGTGVDGKTFAAHVHAQPCSNDGGGLYMYDASGPVDAVNVNIPTLTCSGTTCTGEATTMWQPTAMALASGLSIVIHDTPAAESGAGANYICANMRLDNTVSSGSSGLATGAIGNVITGAIVVFCLLL